MKILFSDNTLWGLLNFRLGVINQFIEDGNDIVLVAPIDEMCNLDSVPKKAKHISVEMSRSGKNPLNDFKYYKALKAIYKSEKPDYIFHFTIKPNIYGTLAAKSLGIRSSAMIAGLGHVYTQGGIGNAIARIMYKYAMKFPEKVMVLNKANYDTLVERKVVSVKKLLWLEGGEGVDLTKFTPLECPNNEKPIFLMICRVLYDKGYGEFVETANALKGKAVFRLMGPIDSNPAAVKRETVEQDVQNGAIQYIEFSPNVIAQIQQADCIVLPSFYGEGLSRVLMEGLAMAKPIITTNIPGCRETVVENKNGFLCEPKNAKSLTEAIKKFLTLSPEQRKTMNSESRKLAEKVFNVKNVLSTYCNIINS